MVIVLIAGYHQLMIPYIQRMDIKNYIIKQNGAKVLFYFDTNLPKQNIVKKINAVIVENCGDQYVYQLYFLYNGRIDLTPYLPNQRKDNSPYYNAKKKDLSAQELDAFLRTIHPL